MQISPATQKYTNHEVRLETVILPLSLMWKQESGMATDFQIYATIGSPTFMLSWVSQLKNPHGLIGSVGTFNSDFRRKKGKSRFK